MKEIFKNALSLFGKVAVSNVMCFIIVISMTVVTSMFFSNNIGYTAYGTIEGKEKSELLYNYYFEEGEDTKYAEYEAKGYKITESALTEVSKTGYTIFLTVSQIFCFFVQASFIHNFLWLKGTKDSNLSHFGHIKGDIFKGLKTGLLATVPSFVLLLFLVVTKSGISSQMPTALYKIINSSAYSLIELVNGKTVTFGNLNLLQILGLFAIQLIVPIITFVSYWLGFKNISISEKFIYKKNK